MPLSRARRFLCFGEQGGGQSQGHNDCNRITQWPEDMRDPESHIKEVLEDLSAIPSLDLPLPAIPFESVSPASIEETPPELPPITSNATPIVISDQSADIFAEAFPDNGYYRRIRIGYVNFSRVEMEEMVITNFTTAKDIRAHLAEQYTIFPHDEHFLELIALPPWYTEDNVLLELLPGQTCEEIIQLFNLVEEREPGLGRIMTICDCQPPVPAWKLLPDPRFDTESTVHILAILDHSVHDQLRPMSNMSDRTLLPGAATAMIYCGDRERNLKIKHRKNIFYMYGLRRKGVYRCRVTDMHFEVEDLVRQSRRGEQICYLIELQRGSVGVHYCLEFGAVINTERDLEEDLDCCITLMEAADIQLRLDGA